MAYTLGTVILTGADAARPGAAEPGRLYLASDTGKLYRDNGAGWDTWMPGQPVATLAAAPSAGGNFALPHGLSAAPSRIAITMTSAGGIWQPAAADATNLYLAASDGGVTATIYVFP